MMDRQMEIRDICVRRIFDQNGGPAVEAQVLAGQDAVGTAAAAVPVPGRVGPLTEWSEHMEEYVNGGLPGELIGQNVFDQELTDCLLARELSGAEFQSISLAVSSAAARAAANALGMPLHRYLGGALLARMPVPVMSALSGACPLREILVVPKERDDFGKMMETGSAACEAVRSLDRETGGLVRLLSRKRDGMEGAGVPGTGEVFCRIHEALERKQTGCLPGRDVEIILRIAWNGKGSTGGICVFREICGNEERDAVRTEKELAGYCEQIDVGRERTLTGLFRKIHAARRAGRRVAISGENNRCPDPLAAEIAAACGADWYRGGEIWDPAGAAGYSQLLRIAAI